MRWWVVLLLAMVVGWLMMELVLPLLMYALPLLIYALMGGVVILIGWVAYRIYGNRRERKVEPIERELEMLRAHQAVQALEDENARLKAQLSREG